MNVTFRQLRAFTQVARCGSFTEAGRALHLTQSATSALVRDLEKEIGLTLMDRTTRKVVLTAAGQEFCARAERILADTAHAITETRDLLHKRRGKVTVAASPLAATAHLPAAIAAFIKLYPNIRVEVHDMLTDGIVNQVRNSTADIGVGTFAKSEAELELVTLFEDRLGVVMPAASPLARKRRLRWVDIADEPLIALTQQSVFRPLIDNARAATGRDVPANAYEVGFMSTAVAFVEAGLGISVLPERAAALSRNDSICFKPLYEPVVTKASTLVTRAGRSLSPATEAFVAFLSGLVKVQVKVQMKAQMKVRAGDSQRPSGD